MTEQLALIPVEPRLTPRQEAVLTALQTAGPDGLTNDEAGAIAHELKEGRWAHNRHDRCSFCAKDGRQILRRLAQLGYARYRRANHAKSLPGVWLATVTTEDATPDPAAEPAGDWHGDGPIPYGYLPEGF